jgi:LuxR family maltose regulon positive regulatory protein
MINQSNAALDMYEDTLLEQEALIKSLPPSPENDLLRRRALLHLALSLAFQNTTKALQIAEDALAEMQPEDSVMGAYLYSTFYRAYGMEGDIEKSTPAYRECLRLSEISGQYALVANTSMIRTFDLCQYGRLDEAADYCQRIIDAGKRLKRAHFYPAGSCYIGLAGIHLERNELDKAKEYLTRGLELCRQGAPYGLFTGNEQLVRLLQAQGRLDDAVQAMHNLEQNFQRREFTLMTRKVALLLAVDDQNGLAELVPTLKGILAPGSYARQLPLIAAEAFKLSLARIYLAQGKVAEANTLLDEIQQTVAPGKRFGRLMETHVLRALGTLQDNQGIVTLPAIEEMLQALELAEGPGFIRLLVEDGQALIPLLEAVLGHTGVPIQVRQHTRKVLHAFGEPGPTEAAADALIEPLTPREMEVLALIADGDSNQEIAEKLVITVRTVKKHASNILGKLNASSRTQAAAYAHQLGLLPSDK